ncbi:hypothetical protein LTR28_008843, partial [Elasticomyces elasticus]
MKLVPEPLTPQEHSLHDAIVTVVVAIEIMQSCISPIFIALIFSALVQPASSFPSIRPDTTYTTTSLATATRDKSDGAVVQGWTPQPNGRGTIDIIWSCVFTIFLCSWSVLCINVPAPQDSPWCTFRRKFYLTGLGILGPEFILQTAIGQWASARRSVKDFASSGYSGWTMKHAFFADMGGFVLHPRNWVPFPIDAKQLHYVVVNGYLPYPNVDKKTIEDRNKIDTLLRGITVGQTLWFLLNCIGRAQQGLAITTFELTTLGFIVCTLATSYCWAHKPADITVPLVLETDTSIADILLQAGDAAKEPYSRTPLDFVSRKEWPWTLYWSFWINVLRTCHIVFAPKTRPINRIPNDTFPIVSQQALLVLVLIDFSYASFYLAGWNFRFPTAIEQTLWRTCTLLI